MKKILLLILASVIMVACDSPTKDIEAPTDENILTTAYRTITIDSCEYVVSGYKLAHKGNCRFCAERRKQEIKELVEQLKEK